MGVEGGIGLCGSWWTGGSVIKRSVGSGGFAALVQREASRSVDTIGRFQRVRSERTNEARVTQRRGPISLPLASLDKNEFNREPNDLQGGTRIRGKGCDVLQRSEFAGARAQGGWRSRAQNWAEDGRRGCCVCEVVATSFSPYTGRRNALFLARGSMFSSPTGALFTSSGSQLEIRWRI